jgi:hypothetical protein
MRLISAPERTSPRLFDGIEVMGAKRRITATYGSWQRDTQ